MRQKASFLAAPAAKHSVLLLPLLQVLWQRDWNKQLEELTVRRKNTLQDILSPFKGLIAKK